jgi:hypothetical protein
MLNVSSIEARTRTCTLRGHREWREGQGHPKIRIGKMKYVHFLLASALGLTLSGCATGAGYMKYMSVWPVNYTEEFIQDFKFENDLGKEFMLEGIRVPAFSKGGSSSPACCDDLPGVGGTIHVIWRTGDIYAPESEWIKHSARVQIKGEVSDSLGTYPFLIIRFFSNDQPELEYTVRSDDVYAPLSPRIDGVLKGNHVMRQPGE